MKEGWEYKKLGEVCDIVGGGTPDTKNKEYWRGNIPWATVSDMNCDIIKSTGYYITEKGLNESSSRIIKKGEIIIATRVGLGKVCKLAVDTAINQDLKGVIPKDNSILRDFIFYYFKHKAKYIVDNGIGATVKGVKIKFIEGLSFASPPLSEQQSIVDYLDSAFAKIDAMKANAEKALNEAKAFFQASLKKMLEPQKEWEEKTLGEILNLRRGHDLTHSQMTGSDYPVAGSNGQIGTHNCCTPISPCITVGRSGSVGAVNIYKECWAHNTTLYIDDFKGNYPRYLYYLLKSLDLVHLNSGSAVPTLNRNFIHPLKVSYIKDNAIQQSIVTTLDSLKSKVDRLQENYNKISQECDALKQAILRKVFE